MTQTSRIPLSRRMTAAVIAVVVVASGLPAQAESPHGGGHGRPAYHGGYRSDHGDHRGGGGGDRGGVVFGALLGAIVGTAIVGAIQPPPAVVYSEPPPLSAAT